MNMTRRELILALAATACASADPPEHLHARPTSPHPLEPGLHTLPLERRTLLYVPATARAFTLLLHGANGVPERIIERFRPFSDELGVILLAPKSAGYTWDAIRGSFGPDVLFIDEALRAAFAICPVDRHHLAVAGFSDGATYAIALGLANGDLFSHVVAFSPGFLIPVQREGSPLIFMSHGTRDPILPIDNASRRIARELRRANLKVTLREFNGEHSIPPEIAREAFEWFVGRTLRSVEPQRER